MKFRLVSGGDKGPGWTISLLCRVSGGCSDALMHCRVWAGCTDAGSSSKSASHASQTAPITGLIYTIMGRGGGVFPLNSILEQHWCFFKLWQIKNEQQVGWPAAKKWVPFLLNLPLLSSAQIIPNLVYNHRSPPSHDPGCRQAVGLIRFSNLIRTTQY